MNANDYQKAALRTASRKDPQELILNGILGLSGEAGEVADHIKKHLFQGHELDKRHIAEELGDICWYIAITAEAIGYSLGEVMQMNIDKLTKRYPNGFSKENSLNRKDVE